MVLGDYLDDEKKRQYIHSRLKPGAILYRHCEFTKPPKSKFLLVLQVQSETLVFVINSAINSFLESKKPLREAQISIDQANHTFLDYDSYINCTEIECLDTAILVEEIMQNMDQIKGCITEGLKAKVIATIDDSFTLSPAEIAKLVASLSI